MKAEDEEEDRYGEIDNRWVIF